MTNFLLQYKNSQIEEVMLSGSISSKYDENGNLMISSNETELSSSVISVNLYSPRFSSDYISKISDTNFSEFFSTSNSTEGTSSNLSSESNPLYQNQLEVNKELQSKINELELKLNDPEKISDQLTIKDTIIQLRIQNGEGTVESDFHDEFPYTAIQDLT